MVYIMTLPVVRTTKCRMTGHLVDNALETWKKSVVACYQLWRYMPETTWEYSGNPITKDGLQIEISAAAHFLNISSSNTLHVVLRTTQIATISFGTRLREMYLMNSHFQTISVHDNSMFPATLSFPG